MNYNRYAAEIGFFFFFVFSPTSACVYLRFAFVLTVVPTKTRARNLSPRSDPDAAERTVRAYIISAATIPSPPLWADRTCFWHHGTPLSALKGQGPGNSFYYPAAPTLTSFGFSVRKSNCKLVKKKSFQNVEEIKTPSPLACSRGLRPKTAHFFFWFL